MDFIGLTASPSVERFCSEYSEIVVETRKIFISRKQIKPIVSHTTTDENTDLEVSLVQLHRLRKLSLGHTRVRVHVKLKPVLIFHVRLPKKTKQTGHEGENKV